MSSIVLSLLLLSFSFNTSQDTSLSQRYEAVQELVRAGKYPEAESEYKAILAEQYRKLRRIYTALNDRERAIEAAETAANYQSNNSDLIELATVYLEAARFDKALEPIIKAARLNPNNAEVQKLLGKTYFAAGNYEKSAAALEVAIGIDPSDFNTTFTLAIAYLQQRQFPSARRVFDRMIAQFGEQPQMRLAIGRAFREAGRLPEAIEEFKKAISLNPNFPGTHYNLGYAYLLNEGAPAIANAEAEFKIELASNPNDFFTNYYLGIAYIFQRKWEPAIEVLSTATRMQPNNPDPYFQLGQAYQELARHDQAIDALKKAIELNPDLAHNKFQVTTAHYRLAQSLLKTGQAEAGQKELGVASELKAKAFEMAQSLSAGVSTMGESRVPTENSQSSNSSSLQTATGIPNALDQRTRSLLEANKTDLAKVISALHNSLGLAQAAQRNFSSAAREFRLAKKWNPEQVGLDYNAGLAYFRAELYREAVAPLESEINVNPKNTQARWLLGLSYFNTREYSKAAALLDDVISSESTNVELIYALASSLIRQGKLEPGEQAIKRVSALEGASSRFHVLQGQLHYARGHEEEAKEELMAALSVDAQTRQAHYFLGLLYSKKQMFTDAKREFEAELIQNSNDIEARYALAENLLVQGNTAGGIQTMLDVVKIDPNFAPAHYELGKALLLQGDVAAAVTNLETAAKLDGENADFHSELGRAYAAAGRREEAKRESETSSKLRKQKIQTPN